MILSGGISVLAGAGFVAQAGHSATSVINLAGYAALGGVFLASALRLGRATGQLPDECRRVRRRHRRGCGRGERRRPSRPGRPHRRRRRSRTGRRRVLLPGLHADIGTARRRGPARRSAPARRRRRDHPRTRCDCGARTSRPVRVALARRRTGRLAEKRRHHAGPRPRPSRRRRDRISSSDSPSEGRADCRTPNPNQARQRSRSRPDCAGAHSATVSAQPAHRKQLVLVRRQRQGRRCGGR